MNAFLRRGLAAAILTLLSFQAAPARGGENFEGPLTQADIDAYVYIAPKLQGDLSRYPEEVAKILKEARLTRRRALYIIAKIPLTQALARGLLSPSRLIENQTPPHLRPTTEEVQLVNANLHTLMRAESVAIDYSGVKVPRKFREAPPL